MIDTIDLTGYNDYEENDPRYFDPLPTFSRLKSEQQWSWIENQLKASTADYLLVVGHYPVYSVCEHGNTDTLVNNLRPLLVDAGAQYLCGHDHCMEHIQEPGTSTNYFLSGMGAYCCYSPKNKDTVPKDSLKWYLARDNAGRAKAGFTSFQVSKESMVVSFYDDDGNEVYSAPAISPRQQQK